MIESAETALRQKPRKGAVVSSTVTTASRSKDTVTTASRSKDPQDNREPRMLKEPLYKKPERDRREQERRDPERRDPERREQEHRDYQRSSRERKDIPRVRSEASRSHERSNPPDEAPKSQVEIPKLRDVQSQDRESSSGKGSRKVFVDRSSSLDSDTPGSDKRQVSKDKTSVAMQVTIKTTKSKESDERKVVTDHGKSKSGLEKQNQQRVDLREKLNRRIEKKGDDLRERIVRKDSEAAVRAFDRKVSVIDEDKFEPDYDESSEPEVEKDKAVAASKVPTRAVAAASQEESDSEASSSSSDKHRHKKKKKHKKHKHKKDKKKHKKHKKEERE